MFAATLANHVWAYLNEAASVTQRRRAGENVNRDVGRLERSRHAILEEISPPHAPAAELLVDAVRVYLGAEVGCETWRSTVAADKTNTRLERVRGELEGQLRAFDPPTARTRRSTTTTALRASHPKRILIAIDQSVPAEWALRAGGDLAQALAARVFLVHVLPLHIGIVRDFVADQERDTAQRQRGEGLLCEAPDALPPGIDCSTALRIGVPAVEIAAAADEWQADLIVMGTHGRGRIAEFILGSTAEAVIQTARCPVMTVAHEPKCRRIPATARGQSVIDINAPVGADVLG